MPINHPNQVMAEIYFQDKNFPFNESTMLWRGRVLFKQYIKNKRHKYGIKYYELCNNDGLILQASIYGGQSFEGKKDLGQSAVVANHLMNDFFDKGYNMFTDNYYNSVFHHIHFG